MKIKEIELYNFRIYKGVNKIDLTPDGKRNIIIVSGNNGFGKTTFLMSLVWCLYGKQMEKVDDLYKREIAEKGGYSKYIGNSLNKKAADADETRFYVSVTFTDVDIPDTPCTEIKITRTYDQATNTEDELSIFIDGRKNELFSGTKEEIKNEEEIFIRDYILPIEIAKFFFFDAEKIVSFAQVNTAEQRQELSRAYSQVLGIQKYESLKLEIERIQDDYRREAARPEERKTFNALLASIKNDEDRIEQINTEIDDLNEDLMVKRHDSNGIQEQLIRAGDLMSIARLNELKKKGETFKKEMQAAEEGLKDIYNLIPFGLSGNMMAELLQQLKDEKEYKQNRLQMEDVEEKTEEILNDLERARTSFTSPSSFINREIRDFYEVQIRRLIRKHFYNDFDSTRFEHFVMLHDFAPTTIDSFTALVTKLKDSKSTFENLYNTYNKFKAELFKVERQIRDAEKNAESEYIQGLRAKKASLDDQIENDLVLIADNKVEIKNITEKIAASKKQKDILKKKIEVSDMNKAVDDEATNLIRTIQRFLINFKEEKKKALAKNLGEKLKSFMHKTNLVEKVVVDINGNGDDVDINLLDFSGKVIDKGSLSMGERQMFASALLGALVEETELEFPVFIDSPMQKFDTDHTKNILTKFYPNVSKQVILFPLLLKELTENEYELIKPIVSKSYLIENNEDGSYFKRVNPLELFNVYKN